MFAEFGVSEIVGHQTAGFIPEFGADGGGGEIGVLAQALREERFV